MASLRQWKSVTNTAASITVTLDAAPLADSLLVVVGGKRSNTGYVGFTASGYTHIAGVYGTSTGEQGHSAKCRVGGSQSTVVTWDLNNGYVGRATVLEFAGAWPAAAAAVAAYDTNSAVSGTTTGVIGPVAVTAGASTVWLLTGTCLESSGSWASLPAGFAAVVNQADTLAPHHLVAYLVEAAAPSSRQANLTLPTGPYLDRSGSMLIAFGEQAAPKFMPRYW